MSRINVNEIFYTIQGEGPNVGKPSIFIRLSGCNLRCYWCDTPYTWLFSDAIADRIRQKLGDQADQIELQVYDRDQETHQMMIDEILSETENYAGTHVVISGGEPLLQITALRELTDQIIQRDYTVEIETNGTINPEKLNNNIRFNVSPKLQNSLNDRDKRYKPEVIEEMVSRDSIFKFVIQNRKDLDEVSELIDFHQIPHHRIFLMAEGKTSDELKEKSNWIIDVCKVRNYNYTHRLHIDLFKEKRGV